MGFFSRRASFQYGLHLFLRPLDGLLFKIGFFSRWASFLFKALGWASIQAFEMGFFYMKTASFEIDYYKTLSKTAFTHFSTTKHR